MAVFQTDNLRLDQRESGVAELWLNEPGRTHNVLSRQVIAELDQALDRLVAEPGVKVLVIRSNKTTSFVAGADLHELAAIKSADEAKALSAAGQKVFEKLADLRVPTIVILKGACLGGGLELALACDYRLVLDQPPLEAGLPEVSLGLLPGWGGTQRLPRRVGLSNALQMILGGRRLKALEALQWGLVDAVCASEPELARELDRLIAGLGSQGKRPCRGLPLRGWQQWLMESTALGRSFVFSRTEKLLRQRLPDDMPAPWEAIQAVRVGLDQGMAAGLAQEREAIGRLASTPACRNLINNYFLRDRTRKLPEQLDTERIPRIRRVGVVGAGIMGAGVAQLALLRGFDVVVQEINDTAMAAGLKRIEELLRKAVDRHLMEAADVTRKLNSLRRTTSWEGFGEVDVVVEAVVEDLAVKQAIFRELEQRVRPGAILTSNTSTLLVAHLQEGRARPGNIAGLHFFNPVHRMPLVEVVQAPASSDETVAALAHWTIQLGKTPVIVRDSPGFVVNRILIPYLNEATILLREGMTVERIDETMRRFGLPMGPLELLDHVGLDLAAAIAKARQPAAGDRLLPNSAFEQMVARGWSGHKQGSGFYRYQGTRKQVNPDAVALLRGPQPSATDGAVQEREARDRMVLLMVNEAAACLSERVAAEADLIDLAMVFGTGWAPHRGGPLRYADDRGLGEVVDRLRELARLRGPRFEPCAELQRRVQAGERFYSV